MDGDNVRLAILSDVGSVSLGVSPQRSLLVTHHQNY